MFLHEINIKIIESLNFYGINYVVSLVFIIAFMCIAYKTGLRTLKRMIKHDRAYLRIILVMLTIDAFITTGLFFYELLFHQSIIGAVLVLSISIISLINGAGCLCVAYNMVHSARKNPFIGMKMYLPMLLLATVVYLSHIHFYYLVSSFISIYVLLFWEFRVAVTVSLGFLRSMLIFIKSICSSMDRLYDKADDIEKDLKAVFFK